MKRNRDDFSFKGVASAPHVEPLQPAAVSWVIDGRRYTLEGAVRLIRDRRGGFCQLVIGAPIWLVVTPLAAAA